MRILALIFLLTLNGLCSAQAQSPAGGLVDRGLYDGRVPQLDRTIRFCIVTTSPLRDFDRKIAEAIGATLLVRAETFDLDLSAVQTASDRDRVLFINLNDNCDVMMGANLAWQPMPDWLTASRPYYGAPNVLAVREGTYQRLDEIPVGSAVGSNLFSIVDQRFIMYLGTLPSEQGWRRMPYDDIPIMLADIRAGTIEAGLLPGPMAGSSTSPQLEGLDLVSIAPLQNEPMLLGALLEAHNMSLQSAIDGAIETLMADGTIDSIIAAHGLPPQAIRARPRRSGTAGLSRARQEGGSNTRFCRPSC